MSDTYADSYTRSKYAKHDRKRALRESADRRRANHRAELRAQLREAIARFTSSN